MVVGVVSRSRRLRWEIAVVVGCAGAGCWFLALVLNDISDRPARNLDWSLGLALGLLTVGCGLFAWQRRPDTPSGRLMVVGGFLMFAEALLRSNDGSLFTLGVVATGSSAALLSHVVVTYPSGHSETVLERLMVVAGYAAVASFSVARATTTNFAPTCFRCPPNRLYVGGFPGVFDALNRISVVVLVALVVGVAVVLVAKWRRAGPATRRVLFPVYASAALIVAAILVARPDFDNRYFASRGDVVVSLALLTFPIALAVGLMRGLLARSAASDLLVELGGDADLGFAAARALGDPTACLYRWDAAAGTFRDGEGLPRGSAVVPGRCLAVIEREGRRLAALDHDAGLAEEPERLSAVLAAIGLALDRARLAREVQAQLNEVASSRVRIVTAADSERRRIERNLHDGAQQRLVGASILIRRARSRAASTGECELAEFLARAADEVDGALRDIRELARGLQPPLLEERGLLAALDSLAESSTVPTVVRGQLDARPSTETEMAAFFVISECLANAAKHAAATNVVISVEQADDDIVITITDDGHGGAVVTDGGGLRGLRDRVEALDGTLDVGSAAQHGTTVTARLPAHR